MIGAKLAGSPFLFNLFKMAVKKGSRCIYVISLLTSHLYTIGSGKKSNASLKSLLGFRTEHSENAILYYS